MRVKQENLLETALQICVTSENASRRKQKTWK